MSGNAEHFKNILHTLVANLRWNTNDVLKSRYKREHSSTSGFTVKEYKMMSLSHSL